MRGLDEIRACELRLVRLEPSWTHIKQVTWTLRFFFQMTFRRTEVVARIISARDAVKAPLVLSTEEVARFRGSVPELRNRVGLTTA